MQQVNHIKASNQPLNGSSFVPMGSQNIKFILVNQLITRFFLLGDVGGDRLYLMGEGLPTTLKCLRCGGNRITVTPG
jgi:hypothetical protein